MVPFCYIRFNQAELPIAYFSDNQWAELTSTGFEFEDPKIHVDEKQLPPDGSKVWSYALVREDRGGVR